MSPSKYPSRLFFGLLIALLGCLAISSALAMLADMHAYQEKRLESRWQHKGVVDSEQWQDAHSLLNKSLFFSMGHPDYWYALGGLYNAQFFVDSPLAELPSGEGVEWLKKATVARPYWPYPWAELAYLKAQSGEVDNDFWRYYTTAIRIAPWEPEIIYSLFNTGLGAWPRLSWEQKEVVIALFRQSSIFSDKVAKKMFLIAQSYRMDAAFCQVVKRAKVKTYLDGVCKR